MRKDFEKIQGGHPPKFHSGGGGNLLPTSQPLETVLVRFYILEIQKTCVLLSSYFIKKIRRLESFVHVTLVCSGPRKK